MVITQKRYKWWLTPCYKNEFPTKIPFHRWFATKITLFRRFPTKKTLCRSFLQFLGRAQTSPPKPCKATVIFTQVSLCDRIRRSISKNSCFFSSIFPRCSSTSHWFSSIFLWCSSIFHGLQNSSLTDIFLDTFKIYKQIMTEYFLTHFTIYRWISYKTSPFLDGLPTPLIDVFPPKFSIDRWFSDKL